MTAGHTVDFIQTGQAGFDFYQRGFKNSVKSLFLAFFSDFQGVAIFHNDFRDGWRNLNHFEDANATLIACCAFITAFGAINLQALVDIFLRKTFFKQSARWYIEFLFATAQPTRQSLRYDQVQRCGEIKSRHTHITQAGNGFRCGVGVQR